MKTHSYKFIIIQRFPKKILRYKGYQVNIIYTDFQKVFDKVSHMILYPKLKAFGFRMNLLNWIYSYLTNRVQSVNILFQYFDDYPVTSGVKQGSVLELLLFLIFINLLSVLDTNINILLFVENYANFTI